MTPLLSDSDEHENDVHWTEHSCNVAQCYSENILNATEMIEDQLLTKSAQFVFWKLKLKVLGELSKYRARPGKDLFKIFPLCIALRFRECFANLFDSADTSKISSVTKPPESIPWWYCCEKKLTFKDKEKLSIRLTKWKHTCGRQ